MASFTKDDPPIKLHPRIPKDKINKIVIKHSWQHAGTERSNKKSLPILDRVDVELLCYVYYEFTYASSDNVLHISTSNQRFEKFHELLEGTPRNYWDTIDNNNGNARDNAAWDTVMTAFITRFTGTTPHTIMREYLTSPGCKKGRNQDIDEVVERIRLMIMYCGYFPDAPAAPNPAFNDVEHKRFFLNAMPTLWQDWYELHGDNWNDGQPIDQAIRRMKAAKTFEEKHGVPAMRAMVLGLPYNPSRHIPYPPPSRYAGRRYGAPPFGRHGGRGRGGRGFQQQQQSRASFSSGRWQATPRRLPFTRGASSYRSTPSPRGFQRGGQRSPPRGGRYTPRAPARGQGYMAQQIAPPSRSMQALPPLPPSVARMPPAIPQDTYFANQDTNPLQFYQPQQEEYYEEEHQEEQYYGEEYYQQDSTDMYYTEGDPSAQQYDQQYEEEQNYDYFDQGDATYYGDY